MIDMNGRADRRVLLLGLLLLLTAVPLLAPVIPPLLDLPGHMGSYEILLHHADDPTLGNFYGFRWQLVGNLALELLILPVGHLLGVEAGTKLLVLLIPVLTALGLLLVAQRGHGRIPPTALLALPFAYNYPFHFGFVNYCFGMALALLAFALWMRLGDAGGGARRALPFALIAPVIWLAHAVAWALLCVLCGIDELRRQRRLGRPWPAALAWGIAQSLPLATPLLLMPLSPHAGPFSAYGFLQPTAIAKWILALNRDRWMAFDLATTAIVLAALALAATGRLGLRFAPRLAWPAAALLAVYLLAPQSINGSAFVGARIIPYAAALGLLAIESVPGSRHARLIALESAAFFLVRTAGTTVSLWLYDRSYRAALTALDAIPRGSTIAAFSPQGCTPSLHYWGNPRLQHLASLAIVRRHAFTNDQWAIPGLQLVTVRYAAAAPLTMDPSDVVTLEPCTRPDSRYLPDAIAAIPRSAFDYVWLLGVPPQSWPRAAWLKPVATGGDNALFRIDHAAPR